MAYTLPISIYELLTDAFNGDKGKSSVFAQAIEQAIQSIDAETISKIKEKKSELKADIYNDLRNELATKEFVRAEVLEIKDELHTEIADVKEELIKVHIMLKVLVGLMIFGFTISNPTFVELVKAIF